MSKPICYNSLSIPELILEDNTLIFEKNLSTKELNSLKELELENWLITKIKKYSFTELSILFPNYSENNLDFAMSLTKSLSNSEEKLKINLICNNSELEMSLQF